MIPKKDFKYIFYGENESYYSDITQEFIILNYSVNEFRVMANPSFLKYEHCDINFLSCNQPINGLTVYQC